MRCRPVSRIILDSTGTTHARQQPTYQVPCYIGREKKTKDKETKENKPTYVQPVICL